MIKLINVTANPFKDYKKFSYQLSVRKIQLKSLLLSNTAIKIKINKDLYNIISPSLKYKDGKRVTWFHNDTILGHKDYDIKNDYDIRDMICDYFSTGEVIEIIK